MSKKKKIILGIILALIFIGGCTFGYFYVKNKNPNIEIPIIEQISQVVEIKEPKTWAGDERAFAVMIDNHSGARPQGGLNDAALVYEIIVEGGLTRLMPIFKGTSPEKIGPCRSARHYFLDYAMENDVIYTHYGESPQADSDIKTYKITEIDGIAESTKMFWRVKDKSAPHNVATTIDNLKQIANKKGYRLTSDKKSVLNYVANDVNLEDESAKICKTVNIPYSDAYSVKYVYNEETQKYVRYANGKKQTDWSTGKDVETKNIIITFCKNYTLKDVENKGRQGLENIGDKKGYYITNGKAIEIICSKQSRSEQTIYKDLQGNEIKVNDGNTFINICPIDSNVTISEE